MAWLSQAGSSLLGIEEEVPEACVRLRPHLRVLPPIATGSHTPSRDACSAWCPCLFAPARNRLDGDVGGSAPGESASSRPTPTSRATSPPPVALPPPYVVAPLTPTLPADVEEGSLAAALLEAARAPPRSPFSSGSGRVQSPHHASPFGL